MDKFITAIVTGHTDHGKTMLIKLLTWIDTDVIEKQKQASFLNELRIAPLQLPSGFRVDLVDSGGAGDLLKNVTGGAKGVDMAILVIAADTGVMPQNKEHLEVLNNLMVDAGFVAISKVDLVDEETVEAAESEIREVLRGSFLEGKPIVPFSAADGRGLDEIATIIEEEAERLAARALSSKTHLKSLKRQVLDAVTKTLSHDVFKFAVAVEDLRHQLESTPDDALLERILADLRLEGKLIVCDNGWRIPSLSVKLPSNYAKLANQMMEYARNLGYVTFSARTFSELHWKTFNVGEIYRLLDYLRDQKKLVRLKDGRYLTCQAMDEIKEKVEKLIRQKGFMTIHDGKQILGYGRSRGIPVLEHLDSIGFTRRVNEVRVLNSKNLSSHNS
jgi:hypothetical protein